MSPLAVCPVLNFSRTTHMCLWPSVLQEFAVTTIKKDEKVEAALKAAYKTKKYGVTGTFGSAGLVSKSQQPIKLWLDL